MTMRLWASESVFLSSWSCVAELFGSTDCLGESRSSTCVNLAACQPSFDFDRAEVAFILSLETRVPGENPDELQKIPKSQVLTEICTHSRIGDRQLQGK